MTVRVKLFAVAKQLAGRGEVAVEVATGATVADVERALIAAVPALADVVAHARWAVDAEFAKTETGVAAQSEVALIPPVSGG
ncbi:MAG TPA: MoaD/ThiS family protein [Lacipirellulaceae bacterium]|jgi:molybdopterin synthase catalytic subunit/molybdopterin synthase sulfur carrier subunit